MLITEFGITVFIHPAINIFVFVSIIALQLSRESYLLFPVSTSIVIRLEHPLNNPHPILVTNFDMVTQVNSEQFWNT